MFDAEGTLRNHIDQLSHSIHVWYIYLHLVDFMVNVGKYAHLWTLPTIWILFLIAMCFFVVHPDTEIAQIQGHDLETSLGFSHIILFQALVQWSQNNRFLWNIGWCWTSGWILAGVPLTDAFFRVFEVIFGNTHNHTTTQPHAQI